MVSDLGDYCSPCRKLFLIDVRDGNRGKVYMQVEYDQVGSAYAAALLDLAKEKDLLEAVHTDVDSLQVKYSFDCKGFPVCSFP